MTAVEESPQELSESQEELIARLMTDIRNGKLDRSDNVALATLSVLEQIINEYADEDPMRCVRALRIACGRVCACVSAGGAARRLLREYRAAHHKDCGGAWLRALVAPAGPAPVTRDTTQLDDYLREVRAELEGSLSSLSVRGAAQVAGERATLVSPRAALAAPTAFRASVILPALDQWQAAARALSQTGARVCVVSPAAVLALVTRADKVVVWGLAGGAGGAARSARGERALAAAARLHNVPVLVLCPLQELCPTHLEPAGGGGAEEEWDVIPADLITLFVTNIGCISPSYMYRLMSELYDPSDYDI